MSNYKERIDAVTAQLKNMESKVFLKSQGENGEYYKSLLDGTLEEFSAPKAGVTTLAPYRFYRFSNLKKADFTGVTEIPDNICQYCSNLQDLVIDPNTIKIGQYAFSQANYLKGTKTELIFNPDNEVSIGRSAFEANFLFKKVSGTFSNLDYRCFLPQGSFNLSDLLEEIDIKVNGKINSTAFKGQKMVNVFNLDKNSNITLLNDSVFSQFGSLRNSPETNIFTFDFRNSTFTTIYSECFNGYSATEKSYYFDIYLPSTCINLRTTCFSNSDHYNIYYKNIPTLSNVNSFSNATNFKNFFPYELVKTAKESTNWSSTTNGIVDSIYGWAEENTFTQGQTLPTTDSEGNTLTWYSDVNLTTQVTTADNPEQIYYCSWSQRTNFGDTEIDDINYGG